MIFQHSTELAIKTMLLLGSQPPGKLTPVREIAAKIDVSEAYLAKVVQRLVAAGLVRSFRGPGKGLELGRAADQIQLASLVNAVQEPFDSNRCILGLPTCSEVSPCALHRDWEPLRKSISEMLENRTLADLGRMQDDQSRAASAKTISKNSQASS